MANLENPLLFGQTFDRDDQTWSYSSQITLRDLFAAFALAGYLAHPTDTTDDPGIAEAARESFRYADAMLAERAK